jgi:hypothetical protein
MANIVEAPQPIILHIMKGPREQEKVINARVRGGIIEFNGMDPKNPVIWLGQSEYAILNLQKRRYELFYDATRKTLIKLKDLGGNESVDSINELAKNFMLAQKLIHEDLNIQKGDITAFKWAIGFAVVIILMSLIIAYMIITHNYTPPPSSSGTSSIIGSGLVKNLTYGVK